MAYLAAEDDIMADVAASLAASAAINASDALFLLSGLSIPRAVDHAQAHATLRKAGLVDEARHLERAIRDKNKAQYSYTHCSKAEGARATLHAQRLLTSVESIAASRGVLNE